MKIICIGRNYAEHAKELNNPLPSEPLFFLKPETALLPKKNPFFYPEFTKDLHYETELVLRICKIGKHIDEKFAHNYYDSIGIGIDFTARDIQNKCKENGWPWEKAKAFDSSAPVSEKMLPVKDFVDVNDIHFSMKKNGVIVQQGCTSDLLFSFDKLISYVSKFFTLKMGDFIFTGTPKGVGPVSINDEIECFIEEKSLLKFRIK